MSDEEPTRPWRTVALAEADAENQRLSAENARLREALRQVHEIANRSDLWTEEVVERVIDRVSDALAAASLSETGGEADEHEAPECWTCGGERTHPVSDAMPCPRCNGTGDEPTSTGGEAT